LSERIKILVTGASGFVGKRFVEYNKSNFTIETVSLRNEEWKQKNFSHINTVVHLAGKAHEMQKIEDQIYFDINYELTKNLFEKIKNEGVKHFIYISSTKVYGDGEYDNLNEQSPCTPTDAYGKSKLQGEQYLLAQTNTIVSIVRPPLIYGPDVKGNMQKIMELCNSNKPLPFANINNKRSMVYVDNLIELINAITIQKKAGVFVAGDAAPLSTTNLVTEIRNALQKKRNLFSIPSFARKLIKKLKPDLYVRLFGSFYVDNTSTNSQLNFVPKYSSSDGIASMIKDFLNKK
jgi:nucleoside-diphosphate-sugar epimerase